MILNIIFIIIGFALLIFGADFLVDGSSDVARRFRIPEIIIGLTIVSIGTSMPELFVSITSALENHADMAIGNVIGSNLTNLLLILGLSTMLQPVMFQKETRKIEIPMCLIITFIFGLLCNLGNDVNRFEACILLVMFIGFIGYTIYMARKTSIENKIEDFNKTDDNGVVKHEDEKSVSIFKSIALIVLGIVGLKYGGDFVVDNAVKVANIFGVSEKIISLTIIAIGTSLPELVTSVTAAIKGNSDIAIGNIIGSNIFNILLIIGVSSLINPIIYNISYNSDLIYLVVAMIVLTMFPFIKPKNEMSRANGTIYFLMYVAYMIKLFVI